MDLAVRIRDLNKSFGRNLILNNFSLDIEKDKIYGLVGKNGAGKTTLLKIISCLYVRNSGVLEVFGEEPFENEKILSQMCMTSDADNFIPGMNAFEIFKMAKLFYSNWDEDFKEELIGEFNLDTSKRYSDLSKGMKSVVNIIVGLASRAPLTIFDEPYSGLDPTNRDMFYKILLRDYEENPRTIIFSTHYLEEVSMLFEKLIIVDKGKLLLCEDVDELKEKSLYLSGIPGSIDMINENYNILSMEKVTGTEFISIFQKLSQEEKQSLVEKGFSIESMPLQKLFINLTSKKKVRSNG
ncbi:ABC transporter ATP-binding protein [uncultured Clostridium sp.]|uniref:ABC transporter ATP-binding protein n=1 Tax=uncultured Clostridium sp. TaxID=59620 RepID=UPI0028F08550|nr:ABC transporter ATP-binding protein [uncultured Clostridium sp.]